MDEHCFHSTYFANPELVGDGVGGGKMTIEKLSEILQYIQENTGIIGFTIAEYTSNLMSTDCIKCFLKSVCFLNKEFLIRITMKRGSGYGKRPV